MTPQEYFMQIYNIHNKVKSKKGERESVLGTIRDMGDVNLRPTGKTVEDVLGYNDEVNKYLDELVMLKIQIAGEIMGLDKYTHQMVLRERYVRLKKWEDIAEEQCYDERWLFRLHNDALEEFKKAYPSKFIKTGRDEEL